MPRPSSSNDFDISLSIDYDMTGVLALKRRLESSVSKHIKYGWINGKKYPSSHKNAGLYIAQVAEWQEYGTVNIPARPYAMFSFLKSTTTSLPLIETYFKNACLGKADNSVLRNIVADGEKNFKDSIMNQSYGRLSDTTIRIKGHDFQMDDSGVMLDNYEVKLYHTNLDKVKD